MKCEHCGCEFEPNRSFQRYCSVKCRNRAYKKSHREEIRCAQSKYRAAHREELYLKQKRRHIFGGKK